MIRRVVLAVALVLAAGVAWAADPATLSREQIEQIVREYLLQHPEVVTDALRAAQTKQREAQQQQTRQADQRRARSNDGVPQQQESRREHGYPRAGHQIAGSGVRGWASLHSRYYVAHGARLVR